MIKLFSKSKEIPPTRKPNQAIIAELERKFKMDDNGFDERYDEAVIADFKRRWSDGEWENEKLESELYELGDQMASRKGELEVDEMLNDLKEEMRYGDPEFKAKADNLRSRMEMRGRLRGDN